MNMAQQRKRIMVEELVDNNDIERNRSVLELCELASAAHAAVVVAATEVSFDMSEGKGLTNVI